MFFSSFLSLFSGFFLFFLFSNFFIANVIAIQSGKNGVNGPAQNAAQAVAMTKNIFSLNMKYKRYPPHTGEYTIKITIKRMMSVFTSLHSSHMFLKNLLIFSFIFSPKCIFYRLELFILFFDVSSRFYI